MIVKIGVYDESDQPIGLYVTDPLGLVNIISQLQEGFTWRYLSIKAQPMGLVENTETEVAVYSELPPVYSLPKPPDAPR